MTRLILMADFGKGPRATGTVLEVGGVIEYSTMATAAKNRARRWWLVECATAAYARRVIAHSPETCRLTPSECSECTGPVRILDQGTGGGR